jgi:hypothetical protein
MQANEAALMAAQTAVDGFIAAVAQKDESQARLCCTEQGWDGGDTRVDGLVRQALRKGLVLDRFGQPHKLGPRAAVMVVLSHPSRPQPLGDLWLLLELLDGDWKIVGATKHRPHAALFLWKALPGSLAFADLEPSDRADAFGATVLASLQQGVVPELPFGAELLAQRLQPENVSVRALKSAGLVAVQRAVVGFQFTTPEDSLGYDVWLVLSLSDREPRVIGATEFVGLEQLFTALDVDWPHEDPARPGTAIPGYDDPTDPAGARLALEGVLRSVLAATGADPAGLPEDDPRREALGRLFASLRRMAPREGESPVDTGVPAAAEALEPNPDAPLPLALPPDVQAQVDAALEAIQQRTPTGIVGAQAMGEERQAFIQTHGANLVSGLIEAVFKELNPQNVRFTKLEETTTEDGRPQLRAIVDPAELLGDVTGGFDEE